MRWTKERAWQWYNERPWIRGCNYMSADCANRVDQWQSLGWEERFETTRREFALMRETGFNTIRVILEYAVWRDEHDGFLRRFEDYISLAAEYGISCIVVLANDCMPPMSPEWKRPQIGPQKVDWGYHGGVKRSQHGIHSEPAPHFWLDEPETREDYFRMVREIVTLYRQDPRILIWDVYNEPGNSLREEITLPNVKALFALVREIDPDQPLTSDGLGISPDRDVPPTPVQAYCQEQSDVITYHCYENLDDHVQILHRLKEHGRPILNTEWLARPLGNDVQTLFPLFWLERIGCVCWGFVAGMYQTYEPWNWIWEKYEKGELPDADFTKWLHDLYRPSHRPYDPKEIEIIQKYCKLADEEFAADKK